MPARRRRAPPLGLAAVMLAVAVAAAPALAEETPAAEGAGERAQRAGELGTVLESLDAAERSRRRLQDEIAAIEKDRAELGRALIETAARMRAGEERSTALEERLRGLRTSEAALGASLAARRGVLAEVLAALQRMGRRPPPAVLVRPEDALAAVRTAMLLGAVLPELREETRLLTDDLSELARLRGEIAADRQALARELAELAADEERLGALMALRQRRLGEAERLFGQEQARAGELASQAKTLKDLIDRLDRDAASARRAAEEARRAAEAQARESRERFAAAALRDPARLAPRMLFAEARGHLPKPAGGELLRDYGAADGLGGTMRGIAIATRPRAVVASPADGWVAFAGPFRSFGQLLIINAGDGYYLLLSGMDTIRVEAGQFVLAGEPVGQMGESSAPSAATGAIEAGGPVLYVEFRKDGGSIDPGPWWAKSQGEKVRG